MDEEEKARYSEWGDGWWAIQARDRKEEKRILFWPLIVAAAVVAAHWIFYLPWVWVGITNVFIYASYVAASVNRRFRTLDATSKHTLEYERARIGRLEERVGQFEGRFESFEERFEEYWGGER